MDCDCVVFSQCFKNIHFPSRYTSSTPTLGQRKDAIKILREKAASHKNNDEFLLPETRDRLALDKIGPGTATKTSVLPTSNEDDDEEDGSKNTDNNGVMSSSSSSSASKNPRFLTNPNNNLAIYETNCPNGYIRENPALDGKNWLKFPNINVALTKCSDMGDECVGVCWNIDFPIPNAFMMVTEDSTPTHTCSDLMLDDGWRTKLKKLTPEGKIEVEKERAAAREKRIEEGEAIFAV